MEGNKSSTGILHVSQGLEVDVIDFGGVACACGQVVHAAHALAL